jgi:cytochrome c-type biogenesis protein CcmE
VDPARRRRIRLVVALGVVSYAGAVPEAFREGREVIVTVRRRGAGFVGEPDTLITKCPSKFTTRMRS